ncbi:GNAT family N-acetyltransferase [Kineosporia sp. NBRC 101731]|uniref:GNAT family N-acetyltransferase n=1 Tax=Kineosporia sp. NBRC 101731 TaxID=3032199 RepID=UPI0024A07085|nr:GNAT family N-acetyltransferase [Kineosporia sp. NBRC 101731]GLY30564.1 hypothetical protein Kisp02_39290 [Kineosporia sp. NBRC 101731]
MWQAFRNELALLTGALPESDGRYQPSRLDVFPTPDGCGYLLWRPHPRTGEAAPIGFAVVRGLKGPERSLLAFWIAPAARRGGLGRQFARDVIAHHPGEWAIAFQAENAPAAPFWAAVADAAAGPGRWEQSAVPVPGRPELPPDQWLRFATERRAPVS